MGDRRALLTRIKDVLSYAGIALAVVGVLLDDHRIVWAAIGLLGVAIVLRLIRAKVPPAEP